MTQQNLTPPNSDSQSNATQDDQGSPRYIHTTTWKPLPPCHSDGVFLFELGKARIHAGGYKAPDLKDWGLIINLRGYSANKETAWCLSGARSICSRFMGVQPILTGRPELVIDWPDGGVPAIKRKEWRQLVHDLQEFDGTVLVHCMGGHGRTGTMLTILAGLGKVMDGDIVKKLRAQYCHKIVEADAQINYLKKNMQIPTAEGPRYMPITQLPTRSGWQPYQGSYQNYQGYQGRYGNLPGLTDPEGPKGDRYDHLSNVNPRAIGFVSGVHEPIQNTFKCEICERVKIRSYMYSHFEDGRGVCYTCHYATDPHNTTEL